jgi:hypothetical protein
MMALLRILLAFPILAALALSPAAAAAAEPPEPPRVARVEGTLALHKTIRVTVTGLPALLHQAGDDLAKIVLYLDGYPLHGMPVRWGDQAAGELLVDLVPSSEALSSWKSLANGRPGHVVRRVSVSVGADGQPPIATSAKDYELVMIDRASLIGYCVLVTLGFVGFVALILKTDLLRVSGAPPAGTDRRGKPRQKAYSLSRTQMAFWFFVVIAAYTFLVMITSVRVEIPSSILALIGISSGTCLGAVAIDASKNNAAADEIAELEKTRSALEVEIAGLSAEIADLEACAGATPPPADVADVKNRLAMKREDRRGKQAQSAALEGKISASTEAGKAAASVSFPIDILGDANGTSVQRLQMAAWTVVLGLVFVVSVYRFLTMPDLNTTLLALMGISNGTYIGFKFPEQKG